MKERKKWQIKDILTLFVIILKTQTKQMFQFEVTICSIVLMNFTPCFMKQWMSVSRQYHF